MTVDIILLLILLVFMLSGYRKGLILSLCSLLILVVSCLGATVAQQALTPKVSEYLKPQVTAYVSELLEAQVEESTDAVISESSGVTIGGQSVSLEELLELLQRFGIDAETTVQSTVSSASAPLVEAAAEAVSDALTEALSGLLIFLAVFLIIFLLLRSLELGLNTVDRLPVIHTLNHLSGGLIGLISGAFLLTVGMAVLVQADVVTDSTFQGPVSTLLRLLVAQFL
jgi:uncharacterized membrane protein required for colicin V production